MLTLTEAAKAVGLSRPAIFKAIKSGRLSASLNNAGHHQIDPAELFRVYKPVNTEVSQTVNKVNEDNAALLTLELSLTRELLEQVKSERDSLKHSLEQALTLLTHTKPPKTESHSPVKSRLFEKLFGKRDL
jgi:hypothetical protein